MKNDVKNELLAAIDSAARLMRLILLDQGVTDAAKTAMREHIEFLEMTKRKHNYTQ